MLIKGDFAIAVLVTFADGCSIEMRRDATGIEPGSVAEEAVVLDSMAYLAKEIQKHNDGHARTFGLDLRRTQGIVSTKYNKRYGMPPEPDETAA